MNACKRCGKVFDGTVRDARMRKHFTTFRCCLDCRTRNLLDFMESPTPPDLLDPFTVVPCLTQEEFNRKVKEMPNE